MNSPVTFTPLAEQNLGLNREPTAEEKIWHAAHFQKDRFRADRSFYGIRAAAIGPAPEPDRLGHTETDSWLYAPLSWQVMLLLMDGEDFALVDEDQKRWFLLIASEVLYGEDSDDELLQEINTDLCHPLAIDKELP